MNNYLNTITKNLSVAEIDKLVAKFKSLAASANVKKEALILTDVASTLTTLSDIKAVYGKYAGYQPKLSAVTVIDLEGNVTRKLTAEQVNAVIDADNTSRDEVQGSAYYQWMQAQKARV